MYPSCYRSTRPATARVSELLERRGEVISTSGGTVVNEQPMPTDLRQRIRDVRVFQQGGCVPTEGAAGRLLKVTPKQ